MISVASNIDRKSNFKKVRGRTLWNVLKKEIGKNIVERSLVFV